MGEIRYLLSPGVRLQWEPAQNAHVLLFPEGMIALNETAAAILGCCDEQATLKEIVERLGEEYDSESLERDVSTFLGELGDRGLVRKYP